MTDILMFVGGSMDGQFTQAQSTNPHPVWEQRFTDREPETYRRPDTRPHRVNILPTVRVDAWVYYHED